MNRLASCMLLIALIFSANTTVNAQNLATSKGKIDSLFS